MDLPLDLPVAPMLAKAATRVPTDAGYTYEPKWDGFRCIVARDGDEVELQSRGTKSLTRYFPEVVEHLLGVLPERIVLDAEIVVTSGEPGAQRLNWDALGQRIHPAASRIEKLSTETPAQVIAFDLLALGDEDLTALPYTERRARLEAVFADLPDSDSLFLTRTTDDPVEAQRWFEEFEGAGLDGVVAKADDGAYEQNKRTMIKVKHKRTAEAVLVGYRVHKSGSGVGSLLLGLYADDGKLYNVGGISAFTAKRREELVEELEPLVVRDEEGDAVTGETDRSRFSASKDVSFVTVRPERVVEVAFDQLEGHRFRHAVSFLRWRPDREPESCTMEQVDRAPAYDLGRVLRSS